MGIGNSYSGLANLYEQKKNFTKALELGKLSLKYKEEINDLYGAAVSLTNIASVYGQLGQVDTALILFKKGAIIYETVNDKIGISTANTSIAEALHQLNKNKEALIYADKSLKVALQLKNPSCIKKASSILRKIYLEEGNSKKSLEMFELFVQMRDSLGNEELKQNSIKNQLKYEFQKQVAADSVKNAELQKVKDARLNAQKAELKQEKTVKNALYGGLAFVIAFLAFMFNRFRVTNKQKKIIENQKITVDNAYSQLEEKNQEVMDSIHYAKRIQTALMPHEKSLIRILKELKK